MKKFFENSPKLLAHRGMPLEFPENTMISFKNAIEYGVDVVETDTHLTKDNQFVILHDADISRVSNGIGLIIDYTLDELKHFDAGYYFTQDEGKTFPFRDKGITFMGLEEALKTYPNQKFNVDLKDNNPKQVKIYVDLIRKCNAEERVCTGSQYTKNLIEVRKALPEMATSFSAGEVFKFHMKNKTGRLGNKKWSGDALQIPIKMAGMRFVTEKSIKKMHERDLILQVWTINEVEEMEKLLKMNVDGIFTDKPRLLKEVIEKFEN